MSPETLRAYDEAGAQVVLTAFEQYRDRFRGITLRAKRHFETRDGLAAQREIGRAHV